MNQQSGSMVSGLRSPVGDLPLIPRPQYVAWRDGLATLSPIRERTEKNATPFAPIPGAYTLQSQEDHVLLAAAEEEGLRVGRSTLHQLHAVSPLPSAVCVRDWPGLVLRAVHLDLKFHPPRFDNVLRWIGQLSAWKINLLVLEYEDRFPFEKLRVLSAPTAWTRDQIQELVARANEAGIEVVPLVQSMGHVEYVLRHEAYAPLRELPHVISQYCPSNPAAFAQFIAMAEEILELHPNLHYLHVGGDEAGFLGRCPRCAARAKTIGKVGLYLEHMKKVCEWVTARGLRPILWDDMVRSEPHRITELPSSTVLMFWDYGLTGVVSDRRKTREKLCSGKNNCLEGPPDESPAYCRYREAGYDVVLASCYNGEGLIPLANTANIRYLAQEAALHGCLGTCATHWAVFTTPPEFAAYGVAAAADFAWNPLPSCDDLLTDLHGGPLLEFDRRFCRAWFGLTDDTLLHALRLLDRGPLYIPSDPKSYPTVYADWCFVDMTFQVDRDAMAAQAAAFFRPDWETPVQGFSWEEAWSGKVAALKREPGRSRLVAMLTELAQRQARGLELLKEERGKAVRHEELLQGIEVGARIRLWRTRQLLHELAGGEKPPPQPELQDALIAHYQAALSAEDARQLTAWQMVGLETAKGGEAT